VTGGREPSALTWVLATISLALPWVGLLLIGSGVYDLYAGDSDGWKFVLAGGACIVLDLLMDIVWAKALFGRHDDPVEVGRHDALIGRDAVLAEAIVAGRGRIKLDEVFWPVSGVDRPAGTRVRVVGRDGTVLRVKPLEDIATT
jgi:hypothetical protein